MGSSKKLFLLLGLLFAFALLLSSHVAASGESTKTNAAEASNEGNEVTEDVRRCYHGCCRFFHNRCVRCCATADEVPVVEVEENTDGRRCRFGCCRRFRYRPGCFRCCASAHEAPDAQFEDDVKN